MKKKAIVICAVAACVSMVAIVKRDLSFKRSSRSTVLGIVTDYKYLNKLEAENAAERFERAAKGMIVLNNESETHAASLTRRFIFSFNLQNDSVIRAKEFLLEADSDYSKKSRQAAVEDAERKLNDERRVFADNMRVVLSSYR